MNWLLGVVGAALESAISQSGVGVGATIGTDRAKPRPTVQHWHTGATTIQA